MDRPPQTRGGGSDAPLWASLIRRMPPIRLLNFSTDPESGTTDAQTLRFTVRGLCSQLLVHVAVAIVKNPAGGTNVDPILASDYPATPGKMQLTPVVNNPEAPLAFLRPVFQDPTNTTNTNSPQGQDIPFGWSFVPGGADEVRCDVIINAGVYDGSSIEGTLMGFVTVEYNGQWWDIQSAMKALGDVNIPNSGELGESINTSVE